MAAKYAKVDIVGSFDADCKEVILVQSFWKCDNILKAVKKSKKKIVFNIFFQNIPFTIEIAMVWPSFDYKINFAINIWKLSIGTETTNDFY